MSRTLTTFLAVALGWAVVAGTTLHLAGIAFDSLAGLVVIAVVYMPSPLLAALVAERRTLGRTAAQRLRLPHGGPRRVLTYLLAPAALVVVATGVLLLLVAAAGALGVPGAGALASTATGLSAAAADVLGQDAAAAAGAPPPLPVLLVAGIVGAVVAGWTVNGLVALGEEYGWRGLMWEQLRHHGLVRANLAIGLAWGLWHAPLILQGYNYPRSPLLGVVAMVVFCTGMSVALTALRELTGSVLPVAAAHGTFNGLAPLLLILLPGTDPVLAGPVGVLSALVLAAVGTALWTLARRRDAQAAPPVDAVARPPR